MKKRKGVNLEKWKIILLSSFGGGLEYYDFVIFAVFASSIGKAFFPADQRAVSLMQTFAVFAIGYLMRPIGGIIFSHFGDKVGRKKVFAITISLMGCSSLLMAILPGYNNLGITATIIFCILRLLQGLSLGGELPGGITFICEHVKTSPGLACGMLYFFVNTGIILADGVQSVLLWILPSTYVEMYAWRIAFIIGGVLAIISYFIRKLLEETPMFLKECTTHKTIPIVLLFKKYSKNIVGGCLIASLGATIVSILFLYIISYMNSFLHYSPAFTYRIIFIGTNVYSFSILFFGYLSDKFGARRFVFIGALLLIIISYPFFSLLVGHHSYSIVLFAYILIAVICGLVTGVFPVLLASIFPTEVRYSGIAFSYNIGYAIFGGLTPVLSTILIRYTNILESPAILLIVSSILALMGLFITRNKSSYLLE